MNKNSAETINEGTDSSMIFIPGLTSRLTGDSRTMMNNGAATLPGDTASATNKMNAANATDSASNAKKK